MIQQDSTKTAALLFCICLLVFSVHASSPVTTSSDSKFVLYSAASYLTEGNWDLDEFSSVMLPEDTYKLLTIDDRIYSYFSIGPSLISIPFLVGYDLFVNGQTDLSAYLLSGSHDQLEMKIASAVVALSAGAVFLFSKELLGSRLLAVALALVFAFGTSAWSIASRAMWQHGPSMLLISVALFLFLRARRVPALSVLAGPVLAFSYIVRPTNAIVLVALSILVYARYRRYFIYYLAGVVALLVPFFHLNLQIYGSFLPPYFNVHRLTFGQHFSEALLANLISPSRGLFVYSPFLALSIYGFYLKFKNSGLDGLDYAVAAVIPIHLIVVSLYPHWWAGHSYGPRFLADIIPLFMYFLAPVIANWQSGRRLVRHGVAGGILVALFSFSIFVHGRGATDWSTTLWNMTPVNVDEAPQRVWDWRDPQFLRTGQGNLVDLFF